MAGAPFCRYASRMRPLPRSFFEMPATKLAPRLLGKIVHKGSCTGIIVETEAYGTDPASHAYKVTPRSRIMRDTYGHWYVYFTYGMHWCANVTCDKGGIGAVLIRAVEPIDGIALMERRRDTKAVRNLASGPAKFCQAFGITGKDNSCTVGADFALYDAPEIPKRDIGVSGRIGIRNGTELPWRFYIKDNLFVSRAMPSPAKRASGVPRASRGRTSLRGNTARPLSRRDGRPRRVPRARRR